MRHKSSYLLGRFCLQLAIFAVVGPSAAADLCQGLVHDQLPHPMTALAKPALGQAVVDAEFGTTIRRITAVGPTPLHHDAAIVPLYSTVAAWNADESLLLLYHVGQGHELYDGRTYTFRGALNISPTDIEQVYWHTSDPDIFFYPSGHRFVRHHASTGAEETLHTFAFCSGPVSGGSDPMFTSWDSNLIGLKCDSTVFLYDIATDTVTGTRTTSLDAPQATASGNGAVMDGWVLDRSLNFQRQLDLASPFEHASQGRLTSGSDTYDTVAFDPGAHGSGVGSLVTFDVESGASRVIIGPAVGWPYPPSGTHVSAIAYRAPGWVFVSIVGNPSGQGVLDNEIVLADTNTGHVCRVAHHRSFGGNNTQLNNSYWAEPHVAVSPSGTRAIFASDWGGGATVDTYVVELPADLSLGLSVSTDQSRYSMGSTMTASYSVTNLGRPVVVDFLLLLILPDGDQVWCVTPQGIKLGKLSQPSTLVPAATNVNLTRPFQSSGPFLTHTWKPPDATGSYTWILAATRPGALADNRVSPGDVLVVFSTGITVTP